MSEDKKKIPEAEISDEELDTVAGGMQKPEIDLKKYPRGDEAPTPLENVANVTSSFF